MRWRTLAAALFSSLLLLSISLGCSAEPEAQVPPGNAPTQESSDPTTDGTADVSSGEFPWANTELTDAITGEKFTLKEFAGSQVYVQAFAVW